MNKNLILLAIITFFLIVGLSGCNESIEQPESQLTDEEKIIGTWEFFTGSGNMFYFYPNGTFVKTYEKYNEFKNGTYEFVDGKLIISTYLHANGSYETIYDYSFSKNDSRLTLRQEGSVADEPYDRK